jgi:hypothetical protein
LLKEEGYHIVIVSNFSQMDYLVREFSEGDSISFETMPPVYAMGKIAASLLEKSTFHCLRIIYVFSTEPLNRLTKWLREVFESNAGMLTQESVLRSFLYAVGKFGITVGVLLFSFPIIFLAKIGIISHASLQHIYYSFLFRFGLKSNRELFKLLLEKIKPDVVCLTRMYREPSELFLAAVAKEKKIPTVGIFTHLDGVTKSWWTLRILYAWATPQVDKILLWSEELKSAFVSTHRFKESKVVVTGCPVHDSYVKYKNSNRESIRKNFFVENNLSENRKLILLLCTITTGVSLLPWLEIARYLLNNIKKEKIVSPAQLLVRLHPTTSREDYSSFCEKIKGERNIVVNSPKGILQTEEGESHSDITAEEQEYYARLLLSADVIVTGVSGAAIDGVIFGVPIVSVSYPEGFFNPEISQTEVFQFVDVFGRYILKKGACRLAASPQDLIRLLNAYLLEPILDAEYRQQGAKALCGTMDGYASRRVFEHIKDFI